MKKTLIGIATIAAALAAQATVYRAGFHQGRIWLNYQKKIPSFDQDSYAVNAQDWTLSALMCNVTGNAGAKGASEVSSQEWEWQNYYGYVYDGEMWMEAGTTYTFGGNFDDGSAILIDGNVAWSQGDPGGTASGYNNWVAPKTLTPDTTGWHPVKLIVYDWEGGKAITCGALSATMWNTNGVTTAEPTSSWSKFADDGSGSLFRAKVADTYLELGTIRKTASGYAVSVHSLASCATAVKLFADVADKGKTDVGWAAQSLEVSLAADETKEIEFEWTDSSMPIFRIHLTGTDTNLPNYGGFWEWTKAYSCTMEPTVAAAISSVAGTSASFAVTLGYDKVVEGMTAPAITLKAYYGAADAGATATGWDSTAEFSNVSEGVNNCALSSLTEGQAYYIRFAAKTEDSNWVWSDCLAFATSGPYISAYPASLYENDVSARSFTISRPVGTDAEDVTVYLSYSANAATLLSGLPENVVLAAGELSVTVPFTVVDNETADGDDVVTLTIAENAAYVRGNPASVEIAIVDDESLVATECVWTGAGDGLTWENAGNWSGRVPTIVDVAKFTDAGLTANQSVTIHGDAVIGELRIETTTSFTLAADENGGSLQLGGITRVDVEGNEGNHTIAVPLVVYAGSETNCVWNIAGANSLVINADISKTAGTYVFKTGAGNVNMSYKNTTFTGPWIIREGQITANVQGGNTFKGVVTIGGGDTPARLYQSQKNSIAGATIHVYTNGTFQIGDIDNGRADNIHVHEGGVAQIGSYVYTLNAYLYGGTYNGGGTYNSRNITSYASDRTAVFNAYWRFEGYQDYTINVARGSAPVDLLIKNGLAEGGSGRTEKKAGNGIVKSTVNFNNLKSHFQINAGTWLVDNPGEYGLGIQETTVAAGAKIGGTGCVGMKDDKNIATLALSNGSESNFATLSPGTIDETTGKHVYGTFTAGRESARSNKLALGNWSHLEIGVGPKNIETKLSDVDKLKVYGTLEIGSDCTLDLTTNSAGIDEIKGGKYTIVDADKIVGTFATVLKPNNTWKVEYMSETVGEETVVKSIVLTVPSKGLAFIIK